ncbi:MAG: phosphodiesterase [Armatimonadetes bacterium]|nr:phosphodiesterase [Candidatus Hippobium faecium]
MKIGILSDSHGGLEALKKTFRWFEGADAILHGGDILYHPPRDTEFSDYRLMECVNFLNSVIPPIIAVKGNCDSEVYSEILNFDTDKSTAVYKYGDVGIVINHGHNLNDITKVCLAKDLKARIFVSGHTHVPVLEERDGVILINPGSVSRPRFPYDSPDPTCCIIEDRVIKIISVNDGKVYFERTF